MMQTRFIIRSYFEILPKTHTQAKIQKASIAKDKELCSLIRSVSSLTKIILRWYKLSEKMEAVG